jgi:hemoglobin
MNSMKRYMAIMALTLAPVLAVGCGSGNGEKENREFFTSGNRDADQRAEQRMAKSNQLNAKESQQGGGTSEQSGNKAEGKRSLFERLGGESGVRAIVDDFVPRVLADPRVNWERKGIKRGGVLGIGGKSAEWSPNGDNVAKLKTHLVQFLALATGGPPKYEGREMTEVHKGMHITNAEFDASVGDMKVTLDNLQIPNGEQKELLSIIESTRTQVAEKQ